MAGAETAGTFNAFDCLTMEDVDTRLEGVFNYFDNNTTKLMIYIGRYMDQRPNFGANAAQNKQGGPLYSDFRFWRGGFMGRDFLSSVKTGTLSEGKDQDEEAKEKEIACKESELAQMQMIRRRASILGLQEKLTNESGRRLSSVEKTAAVIEEAKKLALQEDEEEEMMGLASLFEEDLPEEEKSWKYLPYNPMANNEVDEALAEQLNIWEIDVNIKRLKNKRKKKKGRKGKIKDIYKVSGQKYVVRYIHGVLLCKELNPKAKGKGFQELIPLLRQIAGMPAAGDDSKKKKKGIKIHGN
jgi:hypothetical protein